MIDLILLVVIAFLICLLGYSEHENRKERAKLLNSIIAKNAQELTNLTLADQTTIKPEINGQSDLMPMEQADDEKFDEHIQEVLNGTN